MKLDDVDPLVPIVRFLGQLGGPRWRRVFCCCGVFLVLSPFVLLFGQPWPHASHSADIGSRLIVTASFVGLFVVLMLIRPQHERDRRLTRRRLMLTGAVAALTISVGLVLMASF